MTGAATPEAPEILLRHHLKKPKLPTVLREYEKLARQCAAENVDHVRYLMRLIELELLDREARTVERRIRDARFPAVKSLESFDPPIKSGGRLSTPSQASTRRWCSISRGATSSPGARTSSLSAPPAREKLMRFAASAWPHASAA